MCTELAIAKAYEELLESGVGVPDALVQIGHKFDIANLDLIDELYDQYLNGELDE